MSKNKLIINAWIQNIGIVLYSEKLENPIKIEIKSEDEITKLFEDNWVFELLQKHYWTTNPENVYVSGKLASTVKKIFTKWEEIIPIAALWKIAKVLIKTNTNSQTLWILELSASWYTGIVVDKDGNLYNDQIFVNPHCWAWSWINLSRILQKLWIEKENVDTVLSDFVWEEWKVKRKEIPVRADRCWVFASSATISDKNQWIPLEHALAVTIKSEVLKACKKLPNWIDCIYLTWWVFKWQYARDCATDYLEEFSTKEIIYDDKQELITNWIKYLIDDIGDNFRHAEIITNTHDTTKLEYPSFVNLKNEYEANYWYRREIDNSPDIQLIQDIENLPVNIGLDVGSTMAKIVISDLQNTPLFINSYSNHWDTVETIKHIFAELKELWINNLKVQNIWITGSWRYQVQKVLKEVYPYLWDNIQVLVENYAHARWSIEEAKKYIQELESKGNTVNNEFCILVDVGWEDTKISVVSLKDGDLYDNAMNLKCSAGTGSLMDTLKSLFGIESISEACNMALNAKKAYDINATCAVFLMENAKKLQTEGIGKDEILASCYWAIVENMARTLWSQVKFPTNPLVLLHGQTMLSDPLPLATVKRLESVTNSKIYWLAPSNPWHRACFGLINSFPKKEIFNEVCEFSLFIDKKFDKKIFVCRWAVCGDKNARCNRSMLNFTKADWTSWFIMLGWCGPVNEEKKEETKDKVEDFYKTKIQEVQATKFPKSEDENRIIIPRSFAVSEYAYFFSQIFEYFKIPVKIDDVKKEDIMLAQPYFNIDTCAPNVGATGQLIRLSDEKHKYILVPQIDFLDTDESSLGRTCTTNQWWIVTAMLYWKRNNLRANFFLFDARLDKFDSVNLSAELFSKLEPIIKSYWINLKVPDFQKAIEEAIKKNAELKLELENTLIPLIEDAINKWIDVIIICWREYILNPWVYDSHAGKLFSEKWVLVIPSYTLGIELSKDYDYVYWRNPHYILSLVQAIKSKTLHKIIKNEKLKTLFAKIENNETKTTLWVSLVSTFKCWPDTVTMPFVQEITKDIPFLTIQSDAAINELAHLENRVNTYIKQLTDKIKSESGDLEDFEIQHLEAYNPDKLNKETDVIYFPTLNDNRTLVAVMRASWFTCIDNYDDENYDLEKIIKNWRKFVWDTVCAPLSWVFSDSVEAVNDFIARKKAWELKWKTRIFIFDNAWDGPCRQGQYYKMHKLYMHKEIPSLFNEKLDSNFWIEKTIVKFLVWQEKTWFDIGIEEWWMLQAFQALIMQWVLHSVLMKYWVNCSSKEEYDIFKKDFKQLKNRIIKIFENSKPSVRVLNIIKIAEKFKLWIISKYFGYWIFNNNWIRKELSIFKKKWYKESLASSKVKIYVEWEAYMRIAQIDMVFNSVLNTLWFNSFEFNHSPVWVYFEYLLENKKKELIDENLRNEFLVNNYPNLDNRENLLNQIKTNKDIIKKVDLLIFVFGKILIKPLYKSAWLDLPYPMKDVLKEAKRILPTLKPNWELSPYAGEAIIKLEHWTDLFLNIAPEWCMVSTMWEILSPIILDETRVLRKSNSRIETLLSQYGEIDEEKIKISLLKIMGPEGFYESGKF